MSAAELVSVEPWSRLAWYRTERPGPRERS